LPVYEYLCGACGNRYDKRESFSAPARQKCPRCGKAANRVLQAPPIVFKGSGFYVTDSRKNGASAPSGSSAGESAPASSESPSTDTSSTETAAAS
jgi:putative FmdB family regulatory protein